MDLEIRELRPADEKKAIGFAVEGMHLSWYAGTGWVARAYGRYFWWQELNRATQVVAAYEGKRLVGVLLATFEGEAPVRRSRLRAAYVRVVRWVVNTFFGGAEDVYDETCRELYECAFHGAPPDGELTFLVADPMLAGTGMGVGTFLVDELARREAGRRVFLYTDDGCTYQFYDHRGFERLGERTVAHTIGERTFPSRYLIYAKTL